MGYMKAYAKDEVKHMALSAAVIALGIASILASPFIFDSISAFYAFAALTIVIGLYLSRSLSRGNGYGSPRKRAAGKASKK